MVSLLPCGPCFEVDTTLQKHCGGLIMNWLGVLEIGLLDFGDRD